MKYVRNLFLVFLAIFLIRSCSEAGSPSIDSSSQPTTHQSSADQTTKTSTVSTVDTTHSQSEATHQSAATGPKKDTLPPAPSYSRYDSLFTLPNALWDKLRNSEDQMINKHVHFERILFTSLERDVWGLVNGDFSEDVVLNDVEQDGKLHEHDWVAVDATFAGVNSGGKVVLNVNRTKNYGTNPPRP